MSKFQPLDELMCNADGLIKSARDKDYMKKELVLQKKGWKLYEIGLEYSYRRLIVRPKNCFYCVDLIGWYSKRSPQYFQRNIDLLMNDENCPQEIKNALFMYLL